MASTVQFLAWYHSGSVFSGSVATELVIHACTMSTCTMMQGHASGVPKLRLLSSDVLVLEISLGLPILSCGTDGQIKVKNNSLWEAYSSLDSRSLTTSIKVRKSRHLDNNKLILKFTE